MKEYDENHLWSAGKCFRPIGEITPEKVEHYIRESQSHHYTNNSDEMEAIQKDSHHSSATPQTSLHENISYFHSISGKLTYFPEISTRLCWPISEDALGFSLGRTHF